MLSKPRIDIYRRVLSARALFDSDFLVTSLQLTQESAATFEDRLVSRVQIHVREHTSQSGNYPPPPPLPSR